MNKLKEKKTDDFFTTRPQLASFLMRNGFKGELTLNPYDTTRPAWLFERNEDLEKSVAAYFGKGVS